MVIATSALPIEIHDQQHEVEPSTRRSFDAALARRLIVNDGSASRALRMLTSDSSICHFEALEIIKSCLSEHRQRPIWKLA